MIPLSMYVFLGLAWGGAGYAVYLCIQIITNTEEEKALSGK